MAVKNTFYALSIIFITIVCYFTFLDGGTEQSIHIGNEIRPPQATSGVQPYRGSLDPITISSKLPRNSPKNESQQNRNSIEVSENLIAERQQGLTSLVELIKHTAALDEYAVDELAEKEALLLKQLKQSPQLIDELLDIYLGLQSGPEKQLLRSLFATTQSLAIESYAIEQIKTGEPKSTSDWLALLRDSGIQASSTRNDLLAKLPSLTNSPDLRSALLAITPHVVSPEERQTVLRELDAFVDHTNQQVRSAAIESLSKWGGNEHAHIIEDALFDTSTEVRTAALLAAFSSTIRSEKIKASLLHIMNDSNEDLDLRTEAHSALSGYSLEGGDYENFYQYHLEQQKTVSDQDVKG